jgi:hypothetical protein
LIYTVSIYQIGVSGPQDLANRIGEQLRSELPAHVARVAVVVVDRHLRHRCRLGPEGAGRNFAVEVNKCRAAFRAGGISRAIGRVDLHGRFYRRGVNATKTLISPAISAIADIGARTVRVAN